MFVKSGAHLIDFDVLAHKVQGAGKPAWQKVVDCFGKEILQADGKIDRNKLGNIVFGDKHKITALSKIVHPFVYQEWQNQLKKISKKEKHAIVMADVPLLFEGKKQKLFDLTILVVIEPEEQIHRLMVRNHISREEAQKRLKSQMPIGEKKVLADIVIANRGTISETEKAVKKVWRELVQREKTKRENIKREK
jgi:dephospho-CoA kinase